MEQFTIEETKINADKEFLPFFERQPSFPSNAFFDIILNVVITDTMLTTIRKFNLKK